MNSATTQLEPTLVDQDETAVLGAVLMDANIMDELAPLLEPRDFSRAAHELIWGTMKYMYERDKPIDIVTLASMMSTYDRLEEIGGVSYLTSLAQSVPSMANVKEYAKIIRSRSIRRRGQAAAQKIAELSQEKFDQDEDYFSEVEKLALSIRPTPGSNMQHVKEARKDFFAHLEQKDDFVFTGFRDFDEWMGGLGRGWLYVMAGRPSVGKTAKMLQMAVGIGQQRVGEVAIWSQEMGRNQLLNRMISPVSGVNATRIRRKELDHVEIERIKQAYDELEQLPLHIEDGRNVTIEEIKATSRQLKRKYGRLAAIIVDYLTIMKIPQPKGMTRSQAVGEVTKNAKRIALDLDCPFIMLAQMNREGAKAEEPRLDHLRDSGEIEQDADVVEFLYHNPQDDDGRPGKIITSIIAKGRDVGTNRFKYRFENWMQRYVEVSP